MRFICLIALLGLVACVAPRPAPSCPETAKVVPPESLRERQESCNKVWSHGLDLTVQKILQDSKTTMADSETAELKKAVNQTLIDRGRTAQFAAICFTAMRKDQIQCALAARDLDRLYACIQDTTEDD